MSQSSKPSLAVAIRRGLHMRALSVTATADRLGENRTSVHSWLDRNTFPANVAVRLAQLADLGADSIDQLEAQFSFSLTTPRERRSASPADVSGDAAIFQAGARDDVFARVLSVEAPEWQPGFWATMEYRDLLSALHRGARVAYVAPEDKELARWSGAADVRMLPGSGDLEQAFRRFERAVLLEVPAAKDHLTLVRSGAAPYYLPFAVLTLHVPAPASANERRLRAFLDSPSRADADHIRSSRVELPGTFAEAIRRFVVATARAVTPPTTATGAIIASLMGDLAASDRKGTRK